MPVETASIEEIEKSEPVSEGRSTQFKVIRLVVVVVILLAIALGARQLWLYMDSYESTDDAQVDANMNPISARVSGVVTAVHVDNNVPVKPGDPLVELDPSDYRMVVNEAEANLALAASQLNAEMPGVPIVKTANTANVASVEAQITGAEASVAAAERDHEAALADLRQAEANNLRAQADEVRYRGLVEKEEVSRSQYDQKLADARASAAMVDSKRARVSAAEREIAGKKATLERGRVQLSEAQQNNPRQVTVRETGVKVRGANVKVAQVQLDQARLNLSYTSITAPVGGIVGKKSVEVGQRVQPGEQLMMITQTGDLWITANFKETQLRRIKPGQKVTIGIDAYDRSIEGYVDSLPGATGARYSILPPENATGNYVKVVQRLPVRIRITKNQSGVDVLRPGMSVEPKVWVK
ncbi:MAG TPA: HlyD family secretion protein [Bryobacteraceae bacterium]|jgi:membrane fusion protein (multidrug efflux system)